MTIIRKCKKCGKEFNPYPVIDGKKRCCGHRTYCYDCSQFGERKATSPNVCKKCGNEFPNYAKIDGKRYNINSRKYCLDCSPFGLHNTRHLSVPIENGSRCVVCDMLLTGNQTKYCSKECKSKNYYHSIDNSDIIEEHKNRVLLTRQLNKQKAIEYLDGKCEKCGKEYPIECYDFHHINPDDKKRNVSTIIGRRWSIIQTELDKCQLLCANCHMEIHNDGIDNIQTRRYHKKKDKAIAYLGSECVDCGYVGHRLSFAFHHLRDKKFGIGSYLNRKWDKIQPELDKCVLLCHNCHRKRHAK